MKKNQFLNMFLILIVYLAISAILFCERLGIQVSSKDVKTGFLDPVKVVSVEDSIADMKPTCLVVTDLGRADCVEAYEQFERILLDMKVPTDVIDLGDETIPSDLSMYTTAVVLTPDISALSSGLFTLEEWMVNGGRVMFGMTMETNEYADYVLNLSGALYSGADYMQVDDLYVKDGYMLGGGRIYTLSDGFDSARIVQLRESASVYIRNGSENGLPLVWSNECGKGRIVVANIGVYEKVVRGLYASAYSLLEDVSLYPVLNGSVFYIDDMPSPVPGGDATYIKRDYQMDISTFYSTVWFRDMQALAEKYNFPYTAVIIENYEDKTDGTIKEQTDTGRFTYFGNLLLHAGSELGYHGYNHQPLMPSTIDYDGAFEYHTWDSIDAMRSAMNELIRFGAELFPTSELSVYVPPSNILSAEGRELLGSMYPAIRTVASTYLESKREFAYTQEFDCASDGIVEQPRVVSGAIVDDYFMMTAFSELNMHMVSTHFMHPDDTLDEDRGAALGWGTLYKNFSGYVDWLYTTAPNLRRLTGSQLSASIQRWSGLTLTKTWEDDRSLYINLGNFHDEAYFMLRLQKDVPDILIGAEIEQMTDELYLLKATSAEIIMKWEKQRQEEKRNEDMFGS